MHDRYRAETEWRRTEAEAAPDTDVRRQIAALYVRLAESIAAVLTGLDTHGAMREAAKRPIGFA
jgi:hypothetical protein